MQYTFIDSIHRIAASQWNALLEDDHPFVRHEFFAALEDSGSTTAQRGWQPHHLLIWQGSQLQAALPLFIKQHSYGEYVFDWGWADAYARHGYDYYPKLLTAIPFTPCRGPRLLGSLDAEQLQGMVQALQSQARALGASEIGRASCRERGWSWGRGGVVNKREESTVGVVSGSS